MFDYRRFGDIVFVEGIYRIPEDMFDKWISEEGLYTFKNIEQFLNTKKEFLKSNIEMKGNTQIRAFATDALLLYEVETGKDICMASLNEIEDVIKKGLKLNRYGSTSSLGNYMLLFSKITYWAYINRLRGDYYNKSDFDINANEYIKKTEVYTPKEMRLLFKDIQKEDVYIAMIASLEGITTKELLNLTKDMFKKREENTPINFGERIVKVSDELYKLMYDYSKVEYIVKEISYGGEYFAELSDSDKLFRTMKTIRSGEMTPTTFAIKINNHLRKIEAPDLNVTRARRFSMYYDLLTGMDIEAFNIKYGTKFQHPSIVMTNDEIITKMKQKIAEENM